MFFPVSLVFIGIFWNWFGLADLLRAKGREWHLPGPEPVFAAAVCLQGADHAVVYFATVYVDFKRNVEGTAG